MDVRYAYPARLEGFPRSGCHFGEGVTDAPAKQIPGCCWFSLSCCCHRWIVYRNIRNKAMGMRIAVLRDPAPYMMPLVAVRGSPTTNHQISKDIIRGLLQDKGDLACLVSQTVKDSRAAVFEASQRHCLISTTSHLELPRRRSHIPTDVRTTSSLDKPPKRTNQNGSTPILRLPHCNVQRPHSQSPTASNRLLSRRRATRTRRTRLKYRRGATTT